MSAGNGESRMVDDRWDENNKPKEFIIGVSPGFSQYMSEKDAKLDFQGFWRKIMKATRFGFEFVMIDYEALSEMYEPDIDKKVAQVKETEGVEIGLHLPFAMDLTEAYTQEWDSKQQMLIRGVYAAVKLLKAKFALVHSANSIHPALTFKMGTFERPGKLCAFDGTNLGDFLELCEKGNFVDPWREYWKGKMRIGEVGKIDMKGWFVAKFLKTLFTGIAISPEPIVALYEFETFDEAVETYTKLMVDLWNDIHSIVKTFSREVEEYSRLAMEENEKQNEIEKEKENIKALEKVISSMEGKEGMEEVVEEKRKEIEKARDNIEKLEKELAEIRERKASFKISPYENYVKELLQAFDEAENAVKSVSRNGNAKIEKFVVLSNSLIANERRGGGLYSLLSSMKNLEIITPGASLSDIYQKYMDSFMENVEKHGLAYSSDKKWKLYFKLIPGLASHLSHYDIDVWFDAWKYQGSEGVESQAYRAVAKFMYESRDPLWMEVVEKDYGMEIDPDIVIDIENGTIEIAKAIAKRKGKLGMFEKIHSLSAIERRRLMEKISAAVAGKYIQGHLFAKGGKAMGSIGFVVSPDGEPAFTDEEVKMSVYEYLEKHRLQFYLENGFNRQEGEVGMGKVRIMHMTDHCRIVHAIDRGAFVNYCPDFEHLIVNFIDPGEDIKEIDSDGDGEGYARYITQIHINSPRPINATHGPINPLSTDMQEIYRWLYGLWKKGMKAAYFIWEMGSFGVRESAIAFRKFKEALEKDPPPPPDPEKLGKEFFGIDEKFIAATELAIMEHGLDPLEGLFMVPEEKHGFLGQVVKDKGRIQDWEAEELW